MRFQTESGTTYELRDLVFDDRWSGKLRRLGNVPFENFGSTEIDMNNQEWGEVWFEARPMIGEPFVYWHEKWNGCVSTPVKAFDKRGVDATN